jgi:hypothetical protein
MAKTRNKNSRRVADLAQLIIKRTMFRVDAVLVHENYDLAVKGKVPPEIDSPYFPVFYEVILACARYMEVTGQEGTVDWVFDEQGKIGTESVRWYQWIKDHARPGLKAKLGSTPVFRDDCKMLPLKAADIFAWQIRRHLTEEQPKGIRHNGILDSFLAIYGASCNLTGEDLDSLARQYQSNSGLLFKSHARFYFPPGTKVSNNDEE